jgi:hypothetical protein
MTSNNLRDTVTCLEFFRQAALRKLIATLAIILILTAAAALLLQLAHHTTGRNLALIIGVVATILATRWMAKGAKLVIKQRLIPALLMDIAPSLSYRCNQHIHIANFNQAGLYRSPDRYCGKDWIAGLLGETQIQCSLLMAEERYREHSIEDTQVNKTKDRSRTLFSGLFYIASFNKHVNAPIFLRKRSLAGRLFGSLVALENPEFNQRFCISSTDHVEARTILTPSFMQQLQQLHDKFGRLEAALVDGLLFLALPLRQDAFDPGLLRSLHNPNQVERIRTTLEAIIDIATELGLNNRIWSERP